MRLKILTIALTAFLLLSNVVFALPGIPNVFHGTVTLNGSPAPDGTSVTAEINGVEVASTTTSGVEYGYPIGSFYVDDPNSIRTGEDVSFFVDGISTGQTAIFANGAITELNLAAVSATPPEPPAPPAGGGGGGGGGGAPVQPCELNGICDSWETAENCPTDCADTTTTLPSGSEQEGCQERWSCTEWGDCVDGLQARECTDENSCGTERNKPFDSQPCDTVVTTTTVTVPGFGVITGMFGALVENQTYTVMFLGLIIALILIVIFRKKIRSKISRAPVKKKR